MRVVSLGEGFSAPPPLVWWITGMLPAGNRSVQAGRAWGGSESERKIETYSFFIYVSEFLFLMTGDKLEGTAWNCVRGGSGRG